MKPHIEQTLNDIRAKIAALQTCAENITNLLDDSAREAIAELHAKARPKAQAKRVQRAPEATGKGVRRNREADNIVIMAKMSQPFSPEQVKSATGLQKNGAASLLFRFKSKGWVRREGPGQYVRTAKFPKAAAQPPTPPKEKRISIPGLDPEPAPDLKAQIENALHCRDEARARGQNNIAAIYQDKINLLQSKLDQNEN